jgi:Gamma-glutamyl cyclotransferase, AIG2-like
MTLEEKETENLFSYGTLQAEAVQLATFGRKLEGKPDILVGYSLAMIQIQDQNFVAINGAAPQRNLQFTGIASDLVEGTALSVTRKELEQADAYEPAEYTRVLVQLKSGMNAWVYLALGQ